MRTSQHQSKSTNHSRPHVLITREKALAEDFCQPLEALGIQCSAIALIEIHPLDFDIHNIAPMDRTLGDWIFFTSRNAIIHSVDQIKTLIESDNINPRFAVVGEKSAQVLAQYGLKAHFISSQAQADIATRELCNYLETLPARKPCNFLWPCGSLSDPTPADTLRDAGHQITRLQVYETRLRKHFDDPEVDVLQMPLEAIAFTSASSVASYARQFKINEHCALFSIGPSTSKAIEIYFNRSITDEAPIHNLSGLAASVQHWFYRNP